MSSKFRVTGLLVLGLAAGAMFFSMTAQPAAAETREPATAHQPNFDLPEFRLDLPDSDGDTGHPIDVEPQTAQIDLPDTGHPIDVEPQTAQIDLPDTGHPIDVEPASAEIELPKPSLPSKGR